MNINFVPSTLPECFVALERVLPKEKLLELKSCKKKDLIMYHMGLGMWMRNSWGLWHGSALAEDLAKRGVDHPDDMSGYIIEAFWKHLKAIKEPKKLIEGSKQGELGFGK
jgi:hypothetical protein